jgi:transcriptional regulator with XRE-family HTH domain/tetratricopeptide (TPR) repeat protein
VTGLGNWGESWSAGEVAQLRSARGVNKASFAEELHLHRRTVRRYEQGDTAATDHRIIAALDELLCKTVCELVSGLTPIQVRQMKRRDVLKLLATGAFLPSGGIDFLPLNGVPSSIGASTLRSLEAVSTGLAGMYVTTPSSALIAPTVGHLEDATRLLKSSMQANHRPQLHTLIAEISLFTGYLNDNSHKPAQTHAHFRLAEDHARQAENQGLLAQVLAAQRILYSSSPNGGRDPCREALELIEQADTLARRYAPPIVQAWIAGQLACERARAVNGKVYGAEEALERAERALQAAMAEALPPSCATADYYLLWSEEGLDPFRGSCERLLNRPEHAIAALTRALERTSAPRRPVELLAMLGDVMAHNKQPEEACLHLTAAMRHAEQHDYTAGRQLVLGIRGQFPEEFVGLSCVQELDEYLRIA